MNQLAAARPQVVRFYSNHQSFWLANLRVSTVTLNIGSVTQQATHQRMKYQHIVQSKTVQSTTHQHTIILSRHHNTSDTSTQHTGTLTHFTPPPQWLVLNFEV
jgi:hypothetical protein